MKKRDVINSNHSLVNFDGLGKQISRVMVLVLLILLLLDQVVRGSRGLAVFEGVTLPFQVVILLIYAVFTMLVNIQKNQDRWKFIVWNRYLLIILQIILISTFQYAGYFFFLMLLPISINSLEKGFKETIPMLLISMMFQIVVQSLTLAFHLDLAYLREWPENWAYMVVIGISILEYSIFGFMMKMWGNAHTKFAANEKDNENLVARLGDKYVQLEEARREMQLQYDQLHKANQETEESNKKLTVSLAEFFTVQQISQAISSIFDMYELLKFVNDVIIGVMGVSNSTVTLINPQTNKTRVIISSIFDKRELAVFSDYINQDIKEGRLSLTRSIMDNNVEPSEYQFVEGRKVQSLISIPLIAKGKPFGLGLIEQTVPDAFTNENVRLIEIISQQVSIAIDNAQLYEKMQDMATIDGLTGAYNRIYFQNHIQEVLKDAEKNRSEVALVMCDIDHFKKVNDSHGHQFGDLVLKSLTTYMKDHLRGTDIFARYGGEEFVVIMPHTTLNQAYEKAEELRKGISSMLITDRLTSLSITISMGVSAYPEVANTEVALIKEADDALYAAKAAGRNCVQVPTSHSDSQQEPYS